LDSEVPVEGVTTGAMRAELRVLGSISKIGGARLDPAAGELAVTAGWGHAGKGGVTMPGRGRAEERDYTPPERQAIAEGAKALGISGTEGLALLGERTLDIHLNEVAFWRNVPARVWEYTLGGYQVLKKWLSYREQALLGRALRVEEAREFTNIVRRIAALLLLQPALDENYRQVKAETWEWAKTGK